MNLFIAKKKNHPHASKEGKFINRTNAVEKKKEKKMQENLELDT